MAAANRQQIARARIRDADASDSIDDRVISS
jgi:hypothetical protein